MEKAPTRAFSVIVQPVVEPMDRFVALPWTPSPLIHWRQRRHSTRTRRACIIIRHCGGPASLIASFIQDIIFQWLDFYKDFYNLHAILCSLWNYKIKIKFNEFNAQALVIAIDIYIILYLPFSSKNIGPPESFWHESFPVPSVSAAQMCALNCIKYESN